MIMKIWIQVVCLVIVPAALEGCSEPMGWESREPSYRMYKANLVIYGKFTKVSNETIPGRIRETDINHLIHTDVYCVLKNEKNITIPSEIIIVEEDVSTSGRCVSNMHAVKEGDTFIILISKPEDETDSARFEYDNVNVQGAILEASEEQRSEVSKLCGFNNPTNAFGEDSGEMSCAAFPAPVADLSCEVPDSAEALRTSMTGLLSIVTTGMIFFHV